MDYKPFEEFINLDFKSFTDALFSLNAYEFSLLGTVIGFAIAPTLTVNQQNSLGNFFELIGQIILTINAQNTTLLQLKAKDSSIKPYLESNNIEEEILNIKKEVIKMRKDLLDNDRV